MKKRVTKPNTTFISYITSDTGFVAWSNFHQHLPLAGTRPWSEPPTAYKVSPFPIHMSVAPAAAAAAVPASQSLAVLLLLGMCFPYWIVHICVVAFCLWGPPVMIALMTTAWQPERQRVRASSAIRQPLMQPRWQGEQFCCTQLHARKLLCICCSTSQA
jgi:hypothetical protein